MLNLTDTPISNAESSKEVLRAKVSFYGFAALSALNIILMFIIGEDQLIEISQFSSINENLSASG